MTELFTQNLIPERTLGEYFQTDESSLGLASSTNPVIVTGGTINGAAYRSNDSGARIEIRPEWDPTIGFVAYNASSSQVFKIEIDGTNVGDITIGNYAGAQGVLWDQSAGTFNIKGTFTANAGTIGGWSINATSIYTGTEDHSGYAANAGDMTIYSDGTNSSIHAKNFYIDIDGTLFATNANISGTITASELHIPDEDITVDSFHVESDGDAFWGCTQTQFTADLANAKAYVLKNGVAKFNNLGGSSQFVASDGTSILVKGVVAAIGSLQLGSYVAGSEPETSPTSALSPSAIGTSNWTNPTNAYSSNNVYATTVTAGLVQVYKTFGLGSVQAPLTPHGSTILGIKVLVECKGDAANMELAVRLSPDEGVTWSTAKVATPNNGSDTTLTLGGSTDLWTNISPYTWNTDTITDTYLRLEIQCSSLGSGTTLSVDHITVQVYFTSPVQAGSLIYVSDGQKAGETSSGSGNLAYYDGSNWIATDTGNTLNSGLGLKLPRLASEPAGTDGQVFYDTALDVFKGYNGAWKSLAWSANVPVAFGGDGSDGAYTNDTGAIDLGSAEVVTKNYSSITIDTQHHMSFTNPHANGTIVIIKCSGNATIGAIIKLGNDSTGGQTGASGGAGGARGDVSNGYVGENGNTGNDPTGEWDSENTHGGDFGEKLANCQGAGAGGGGQIANGGVGTEGGGNCHPTPGDGGTRQYYFTGLFDRNHQRKTYFVACGAGGGGGAGGSGNFGGTNGHGGDGGNGGGVLILEVAGDFNVTGGAIEAEGANGEDGENGGNYGDPNFPRNGGGSGGGAGGTVIVLYKGTLTGTLTPSVAGGAGGNGGEAGPTGNYGGDGGAGAAGSYIFEKYIW